MISLATKKEWGTKTIIDTQAYFCLPDVFSASINIDNLI